jgi:ABC-type xylose transport system substrate-binding protein
MLTASLSIKYMNFYVEMENLQIGRLQVIIDRLEILKKNIASLYELLKGSGDLQVGKLQTIADKLEALKNSLEESVRF